MSASLSASRYAVRASKPTVYVRVAVLIAMVASCSDTPTAPKSVATSAPTRAAFAVADDPGLNWSDTWMSQVQVVAETTVVSATEPFLDPFADQYVTTMTVAGDPESVGVLAGYGYDGVLRVTTGFDATDFQETSLVRLVGTTPYDMSAVSPLAPSYLDGEPLATLGDLSYQQLTPGGGTPVGCDPTAIVCTYATSANPGSMSGPDASPRFTRIDDNHLRAVVEIGVPAVTSAPAYRPSSATPASQGAQSQSAKSRETRDFEKRGKDWVLVHIKRETDAVTSVSTLHHVLHHVITNVSYQRNARLDAERAKAARNGIPPGPSVAKSDGSVGSVAADCSPNVELLGCYDTGGVSGGVSVGPSADETTLPDSNLSYGTGGSPLLLFQHGFKSAGATWERMGGWMHADRPAVAISAPTLPWRSTYEVQADSLENFIRRLNAPTNGPTIIIGHSNGGMIARNLMRRAHTANVQGIITLGTPHFGTPLASNYRTLARVLGVGGGLGFGYLSCSYVNGAGCGSIENAVTATGPYFIQYGAGVDVLSEMHWADSYHDAFNADTEPVQRFGIQSEAWRHWLLWRMYGDMKCFPEDALCGGGAQVAKVDRIYHHDIACSIISGLFSWFRTSLLYQAAECAADAVILRGFDGLYSQYAGHGGGSDGAVPVVSQVYPRLPTENNQIMEDGPSHLGETRHPRSRATILGILPRIVITP